MNEDEFRNQELNKYLDQEEADNTEVSNCCGAIIYDDSDICSDCKEHCVIQSQADYMFDAHQAAIEDKADEARDRIRDE